MDLLLLPALSHHDNIGNILKELYQPEIIQFIISCSALHEDVSILLADQCDEDDELGIVILNEDATIAMLLDFPSTIECKLRAG